MNKNNRVTAVLICIDTWVLDEPRPKFQVDIEVWRDGHTYDGDPYRTYYEVAPRDYERFVNAIMHEGFSIDVPSCDMGTRDNGTAYNILAFVRKE